MLLFPACVSLGKWALNCPGCPRLPSPGLLASFQCPRLEPGYLPSSSPPVGKQFVQTVPESLGVAFLLETLLEFPSGAGARGAGERVGTVRVRAELPLRRVLASVLEVGKWGLFLSCLLLQDFRTCACPAPLPVCISPSVAALESLAVSMSYGEKPGVMACGTT